MLLLNKREYTELLKKYLELQSTLSRNIDIDMIIIYEHLAL